MTDQNTDLLGDRPTSDRTVAIRQAIRAGERGLMLQTMDDFARFAMKVAASQFCPPGFSEVDCFIALQKGAEVGLSPMQSLESIYVVNNRATLFGDAPKALVEASGLMIDYSQEEIGTYPQDSYGYRIESLRKGRSKPIVSTFTIADAKTAQIWGKTSKDGNRPTPWITAPKRMLMWRARGFNLRDNFPDVLKGLQIGELVDEEARAGFENAKAAVGRVVEPNFDRESPLKSELPVPADEAKANLQKIKTAVAGTEEPRPRRGRPPKSAGQENLQFSSPAQKPQEQISETKEIPKDSAGDGKPAESMAKPEPEPSVDPKAKLLVELKGWLEAEKLSVTEFLRIMERNELVKAGGLLEDIEVDGLQLALKQKKEIADHLRELASETPFA